MRAGSGSSKDMLYVERIGDGKMPILFESALIENRLEVYLNPNITLKHDLRKICKIINLALYNLYEIVKCNDLLEKGVVFVSVGHFGSDKYKYFVGLVHSVSRLKNSL